MILNEKTAAKVGEILLDAKAVVLRPEAPFTWASGWKSPIYCDNRKTLSFPQARTYIRNAMVEAINTHFGNPDVIAGVATGGIAQGALVAQEMELPFIYIRSKAKGHGLTNAIEGVYKPGQKVVVIEDLVSTGGSSLKAVEALREAGCEVVGMVAIFTYGFEVATNNFANANVELITLGDYQHLIKLAVSNGTVTEAQTESLAEWRKAPQRWHQPEHS